METGNGYSDILFESVDGLTGVIIEIKQTNDDSKLDLVAAEAISQIETTKYYEVFKR